MFIIKVTVKENSLAWDRQRDELLHNVEGLEIWILNPMQYIDNFSQKRDKVSIAITSSTFILFSTYSKVPSKHSPIIQGLILNMVVKSMWKIN